DGGTMGLELLPYVEDKEHVIIVDVVKSGNPPGAIVRIEGNDVPVFLSSKISPHQLGLSDLLAVAQITGRMPRHVVLIGIEPERIDTGLDLSGAIQSKIDTLVTMVIEELEAAGIHPSAKS
ncbi:MAG TPA: hydrogenase maturation protease, partial [Dissulfurispiraceae bacterium]|nr:hydrogenase maturation protease [Dissulfurispiraceae bacterium]